MAIDDDRAWTRREFLAVAAGSAVTAIGCASDVRLAADGGTIDDATVTQDASDAVMDASPTPSCPESDTNILGPAYVEGAPVRANGELNVLGWAGRPLTLTGRVLSGRECAPLPGAELDVWQADDAGCYDGSAIGCGPLSAEWPLRGRIVTDAEGRYQVRTIYPGLYPGRTRHIHVIVRAPGHHELTTQLYFAGEPANATDAFILPSLMIELEASADGSLSGVFDIVVVVAV